MLLHRCDLIRHKAVSAAAQYLTLFIFVFNKSYLLNLFVYLFKLLRNL